MHNVEEQVEKLPQNIRVELRGSVKNSSIIDFYKSTNVDAFLHFSESEGGVPVSIQEAVSFSIPVIARNAGGVSEIVNNQTGLLLPYEIDLNNEINSIRSFIYNECRDSNFRRNIKSYFETHFLADVNYTKFIKEIIRESTHE
jgi:glycosyltransferase involved in cell wall biosynthesis